MAELPLCAGLCWSVLAPARTGVEVEAGVAR